MLAGQNLTYTITVVNNGPSSAVGASISDHAARDPDVRLGLDIDGSGGERQRQRTCDHSARHDCRSQRRDRHGDARRDAPVLVTTTIPDTATVTSSTPDPNSANNTATTSVTANPSADVGVTITASAASVTAGQNLTYTIDVTNNGPATATNVMLTNVFPANVVFVSSSTSVPQGTAPTPGSPTVSLGALAANSTDAVTIVVTPGAAGGPLDHRLGQHHQPADRPGLDEQFGKRHDDRDPQRRRGGDDLRADLRHGGWSNLSYTITVTNHGPSTATGVVLTDTLPPLPADGTFVGLPRRSGRTRSCREHCDRQHRHPDQRLESPR